tara:strand:- start:469 stop:1773 length:1305 start_codon:yes stop_codon:yes gene_type:complete
MKSIYDLLFDWYKSNPDFEFINYQKSYSLQDIVYEVEAVSKSLKYIPSDHIGILIKSKLDFIVVYLSCIKSNKVPIVLKNNWGDEELNSIIKNNKIDHVISEWGNKIKDVTTYFVEEIINSSRGCGIPNDSLGVNSYESIIFTSGSMGLPKGVRLSRESFYASARAWNNEIIFEPEDRYAVCLSLDHISGIAVLYRSIYYRFGLNIFDNYRNIHSLESSIISLVPTILNTIIHDNEYIQFLKSYKAIILGGEPATKKLLEHCLDLNLNVYVSYGMSETCSGISGFWINDYPDKIDSVGRAFDGVDLSISDNVISIKSDMNMIGYYLENKLSDSFITSDKGCIVEDFLYIDSQRDNIAISGGEKINIDYIKKTLLLHKLITSVNIKIKNDEIWGQSIYADVSVDSDLITELDIKKWCENMIGKYKTPKKINIKNL